MSNEIEELKKKVAELSSAISHLCRVVADPDDLRDSDKHRLLTIAEGLDKPTGEHG